MKESNLYFKHIYVEKDLKNSESALHIIEKIRPSFVIEINNYLEIFGRKKQSFLLQKKSPSLILAKKRSKFLYPNPIYCQDFGFERSFYSSIVLNCIFDCKYCFLQGMYSSANIVIFLNLEDFLDEILKECARGNFLLFLSYNTDLLAIENFTGIIHRIYDFLKDYRMPMVEIRTKSSNFSSISDLKPIENIILAWSLLPQELIYIFEDKTASLAARIDAINKAIESGWNVRLIFDPVIVLKENKEKIYEKFFDEIAKRISIERVKDIGVGNFRMNKNFMKKLISERPDLLRIDFENYLSFEKILKNIRETFVEKSIFIKYNFKNSYGEKDE
jgi:spore photoproduct lyase